MIKSRLKDTIFRSKKMKSINTNRNWKTLRPRIMEQILNLMMNSLAMRRQEIFDISTEVSWIQATSDTVMEYSWRSQISVQIGNLKLDRYPTILSISATQIIIPTILMNNTYHIYSMNINHTEEVVTSQNPRYILYFFPTFPLIYGQFPNKIAPLPTKTASS